MGASNRRPLAPRAKSGSFARGSSAGVGRNRAGRLDAVRAPVRSVPGRLRETRRTRSAFQTRTRRPTAWNGRRSPLVARMSRACCQHAPSLAVEWIGSVAAVQGLRESYAAIELTERAVNAAQHHRFVAISATGKPNLQPEPFEAMQAFRSEDDRVVECGAPPPVGPVVALLSAGRTPVSTPGRAREDEAAFQRAGSPDGTHACAPAITLYRARLRGEGRLRRPLADRGHMR